MNEFLRQMAVLGILTTLAEHLLPEGGIRRAGRMVMGLLMMLTMLTAMLQMAKLPLPDVSGAQRDQQQAELRTLVDPGSYRDTVLSSLRRQIESAAAQAARRAGREDITARAELDYNGGITAIYLIPAEGTVAAFAGTDGHAGQDPAVMEQVARALSIEESLVHWGAEGTPQ
jgi:hypothetical protein